MKLFNYFFSPFVRPKLHFYFGKISVGVPYFLPRKTIKDPQKPGQLKFVPRNFGFDFCRLGWKTKWNDKDIRFEWPPIFSFVFFGFQLAITVKAREANHYWESWLYYHLHTDKSKLVSERVKKLTLEFPQNYIRYKDGVEEEVDCYQTILKKKWRPLSKSEKRDKIIDTII